MVKKYLFIFLFVTRAYGASTSAPDVPMPEDRPDSPVTRARKELELLAVERLMRICADYEKVKKGEAKKLSGASRGYLRGSSNSEVIMDDDSLAWPYAKVLDEMLEKQRKEQTAAAAQLMAVVSLSGTHISAGAGSSAGSLEPTFYSLNAGSVGSNASAGVTPGALLISSGDSSEVSATVEIPAHLSAAYGSINQSAVTKVVLSASAPLAKELAAAAASLNVHFASSDARGSQGAAKAHRYSESSEKRSSSKATAAAAASLAATTMQTSSYTDKIVREQIEKLKKTNLDGLLKAHSCYKMRKLKSDKELVAILQGDVQLPVLKNGIVDPIWATALDGMLVRKRMSTAKPTARTRTRHLAPPSHTDVLEHMIGRSDRRPVAASNVDVVSVSAARVAARAALPRKPDVPRQHRPGKNLSAPTTPAHVTFAARVHPGSPAHIIGAPPLLPSIAALLTNPPANSPQVQAIPLLVNLATTSVGSSSSVGSSGSNGVLSLNVGASSSSSMSSGVAAATMSRSGLSVSATALSASGGVTTAVPVTLSVKGSAPATKGRSGSWSSLFEVISSLFGSSRVASASVSSSSAASSMSMPTVHADRRPSVSVSVTDLSNSAAAAAASRRPSISVSATPRDSVNNNGVDADESVARSRAGSFSSTAGAIQWPVQHNYHVEAGSVVERSGLRRKTDLFHRKLKELQKKGQEEFKLKKAAGDVLAEMLNRENTNIDKINEELKKARLEQLKNNKSTTGNNQRSILSELSMASVACGSAESQPYVAPAVLTQEDLPPVRLVLPDAESPSPASTSSVVALPPSRPAQSGGPAPVTENR